MKKKFLSCVAAGALAVGLVSTAIAATNTDENSGISVTIETDKDSYNNGDVMEITWSLANTSSYTIRNLTYEISVPEGVVLPENARTSGTFAALAGNAVTMPTTITSEKLEGFQAPTDENGNKIENESTTGGSGGSGEQQEEVDPSPTGDVAPVVALVAFASFAGISFFLASKKQRKNGTSLFLVLVIGLSTVGVIPVDAAPTFDKMSVTAVETVTIEGAAKDVTITVKIDGSSDENVTVSNIGIHDPSVFYDPVSGEYFSYGSHIIAGNSDDLISWTYVAKSSNGYQTSNELFSKHYLDEFAEVYEWLGEDVVEGIWALDVTYSEAAAKAGNDPYFMYVTVTNGTRDALCLATAAKPEGPFSYKEAIVFSDFRESEVENGPVNLLDVLGVDSVSEMTAEQKDYYLTDNTTEYRAKFPQCIDAAPYYDGDGNMYMAYGSFSATGALHVLKMDPLTGLRADTNYSYDPEELQDPYFGRQISTKRGEGPYVLTVKSDLSSTGYYYFLFWSQGVLSATGGYNMRMLRSEYPDRGFVDYSGKDAMDSSVVGVRIMDNFMFTTMKYSSTANGGNSAIVTKDGKMFLHYHSKSAHTAAYGDNGFIIKSNQMFLNEEGWLVTTPFKYNGETMAPLTKADVVGDYEFIYHTLNSVRHPANIEDNYVSSKFVRLNEDGTVTGAYSGTWSMNDNYFTIKIDNKTYKGVVLEQYDESAERVKTVVFTAEGTDNRTVWGSKIYYTDAERVAVDMKNISVTTKADEDFTLPTAGRLNSKITWTSDNAAIKVNGSTADVVRQDSEQTVTLKATFSFGNATQTKEFKVTVPEETFTIPSTISVSTITLPEVTEAGKAITWASSNPAVINVATGVVNVPEGSSVKVTLTGTIAGSDKVITKEITVMPLPTTVVYSENYDNLTGFDPSKESNLWYSKFASAALTLKDDANGGKYVNFAPGNANSRGAISKFPTEAKLDGIYILEFDLALTAGNDQTTEFAAITNNISYLDPNNNGINNGAAGGYLFKLSATNSTTWAVNDGDTFPVAKGDWMHVHALADTESATVQLTITNDDATLYSGTISMSDAGALEGFYIRGGRKNSVTSVDNVTLKQN